MEPLLNVPGNVPSSDVMIELLLPRWAACAILVVSDFTSDGDLSQTKTSAPSLRRRELWRWGPADHAKGRPSPPEADELSPHESEDSREAVLRPPRHTFQGPDKLSDKNKSNKKSKTPPRNNLGVLAQQEDEEPTSSPPPSLEYSAESLSPMRNCAALVRAPKSFTCQVDAWLRPSARLALPLSVSFVYDSRVAYAMDYAPTPLDIIIWN